MHVLAFRVTVAGRSGLMGSPETCSDRRVSSEP